MHKGAIVTGGGKRIGRLIALGLAKAGYDILLHFNNSRSGAESTQETIINQYGRKCTIFNADLRQPSNCKALADKAFEAIPTCSLLVNNASIFHNIKFMDTSWQHLTENMNIHIISPFELAKQFAHNLSGSTGTIINIVDRSVLSTGMPFFSYALSKHCMLQLTKLTEHALSARGIRAHALCPGIMMRDAENGEYCDRASPENKTDAAEMIREIIALATIQPRE